MGINGFDWSILDAEAGLEEGSDWGDLIPGSGCWGDVSNSRGIIESRSPDVLISIKWPHDACFVASLSAAEGSNNSLNSQTLSHRILIDSVQKGIPLLFPHPTHPPSNLIAKLYIYK